VSVDPTPGNRPEVWRNTFAVEWPPRSGRQQEFPEIDRAAWSPLDIARVKILKGQVGFIDELIRMLKDRER
jgi:predicted NUDIX family NTP pyrophosphohydrolase